MPCDTIQLMKVHMGKLNVDLLLETLAALGVKTPYQDRMGNISFYWIDGTYVQINLKTGDANLPRYREAVVDEIKKAYSTQAVKKAAQRFGWTVQTTGVDTMELNRRF